MDTTANLDMRERARGLLAAIRQLATTCKEVADERTSRLASLYRAEFARLLNVAVLTVLGAFFASVAAGFLAFTVLLALWEGHRVAAAGGIAVGFALLALLCGTLASKRLHAPLDVSSRERPDATGPASRSPRAPA